MQASLGSQGARSERRNRREGAAESEGSKFTPTSARGQSPKNHPAVAAREAPIHETHVRP